METTFLQKLRHSILSSLKVDSKSEKKVASVAKSGRCLGFNAQHCVIIRYLYYNKVQYSTFQL